MSPTPDPSAGQGWSGPDPSQVASGQEWFRGEGSGRVGKWSGSQVVGLRPSQGWSGLVRVSRVGQGWSGQGWSVLTTNAYIIGICRHFFSFPLISFSFFGLTGDLCVAGLHFCVPFLIIKVTPFSPYGMGHKNNLCLGHKFLWGV